MAESFVQVAPDSTGKKLRTRQRVIGANTVEEQYVIEAPNRVNVGTYVTSPVSQTIQAAAHAAGAGFFVLLNRSAAQMVELRRVEFIPFRPAVTVFASSPEVALQRFTYTGTPNGTQTVPARTVRTAQNGEPADATPIAELRVPGAETRTVGEIFHRFVMPATLIAFSANSQSQDVVVPQTYRPTDDDGRLVLANGEGVLIRQDTAGTASDTRKFVLNIAWSEYTIP